MSVQSSLAAGIASHRYFADWLSAWGTPAPTWLPTLSPHNAAARAIYIVPNGLACERIARGLHDMEVEVSIVLVAAGESEAVADDVAAAVEEVMWWLLCLRDDSAYRPLVRYETYLFSPTAAEVAYDLRAAAERRVAVATIRTTWQADEWQG